MASETFGYGRVSSTDQNPDLQINALIDAGVPKENIFIEKKSGKNMDRPKLKELRSKLRKGDTITIWKLDRLGRSLSDLLNIVKEFEEKVVSFKSLTENFDTTTPQGKLFFAMCGAFAEYERSMIQERVREGIKAAKEKGTKFGRPIKADEEVKAMIIALHNQHVPKKEICSRLGVARSTVYRAINESLLGT
jgi:DNA invertase Pin-like site-specific DNA recombinase|tara:strand:+ start:170 stop:745 length:576 start_codon:yes stop_codon:yes gene_type:complete